MRSSAALVLIAVAAVAAMIVGVGSANAAQQVPFTITEHIDFTTGAATFTAIGPLCPSGTFDDSVAAAGGSQTGASGRLNLLIQTVYICDDGSGTFTALKHVFITFTQDGFTNTGPVQILSGAGTYPDLVGHGVDNGSTTGDIGVGEITGWVTPVGRA